MSIATMRREPLALAANEERAIYAPGEYFAVLAATGDFEIGIEDQPLSSWAAGLKVGNPPDGQGRRRKFRYLRLRNLTAGPITIDLVTGSGDFTDSRLTVSGDIDISKSAALVTVPDVALGAAAATLIVAANATRREVLIHNATSAAIRVGDANVAAARGVEIAAGAVLTLATGAAVYGYSVPGGNVSVTEVRD